MFGQTFKCLYSQLFKSLYDNAVWSLCMCTISTVTTVLKLSCSAATTSNSHSTKEARVLTSSECLTSIKESSKERMWSRREGNEKVEREGVISKKKHCEEVKKALARRKSWKSCAWRIQEQLLKNRIIANATQHVWQNQYKTIRKIFCDWELLYKKEPKQV